MLRRKAWPCAASWRSAAFRRSMRSICSKPFAATVTKLRYRDWDDLIDYCRYSAPCRWAASCWMCMAKTASMWPANDALCAALQVINHLQDCAKDYRDLNRVYIPETAAGRGRDRTLTALGAAQGQPGAAERDRRPGAQQCRIAGQFARLCRRRSATAACAGSRSDPNPGRRSQHHADQAAIRCRKACIIPRWTWRPCS